MITRRLVPSVVAVANILCSGFVASSAIAAPKEDPVERASRANRELLGYWVLDKAATLEAWSESDLFNDQELKALQPVLLKDAELAYLHVQRRSVIKGCFSDDRKSTTYDVTGGQGNYDQELRVLKPQDRKTTSHSRIAYSIDKKQLSYGVANQSPKHKPMKMMVWKKISDAEFSTRLAGSPD